MNTTLKRTARTLALASLLTVAGGLSGCIVAAAAIGAGIGYGVYEYVNGEIETVLGSPLAKVHDATVAMFKRQNITLVTQNRDGMDGRVEGKDANGDTVLVKLHRESDSATKVSIRIATFGDEAKSRFLMDDIKKGL